MRFATPYFLHAKAARPNRAPALALAAVLLLPLTSEAINNSNWQGGQLAPSGYSAAINTPTADVLPFGNAGLALSNSNPEVARRLHGTGGFGSINAGLGIFPGLELVGRLAFEGDLQCNTFSIACKSRAGQRDLSLSGKYRLPLTLPGNSRLALGFTDYGGAATNYRQTYAVLSKTWGALDVSAGYGRAGSKNALLRGAFGSAQLRISERLAAALEYDSREWRAGAQYRHPIGQSSYLQLGLSRKFSHATAQQSWQWTTMLQFPLGQGKPIVTAPIAAPSTPNSQAIAQASADAPPTQQPEAPKQASPHHAITTLPPSTPAVTPAQATAKDERAQALAQQLQAQGFSHIQVRYWPPKHAGMAAFWQIEAEPKAWRQNALDGLAVALQQWLQLTGKESADQLALRMLYQGRPTVAAYAQANCLHAWVWQDISLCQSGADPLALRRADPRAWQGFMQYASERGGQALMAQADTDSSWAPQFEISPSLRSTIGTEAGLADYSLALELGAEVPLAKGWFWQGTYQIPISRSGDYKEGGVFAPQRHPSASFDTAALSYIQTPSPSTLVQLSAGYLNRDFLGGQIDALWLPTQSPWQLGATLGRYKNENAHTQHNPALLRVQYELVPARWNVQTQLGQFLHQDKGYRIASQHWFGDTEVQLYFQSTKASHAGKNNGIGILLSLPLGTSRAHTIATTGATVRAADRWSWGLKTRVGSTHNALLNNVAVWPQLRHGIYTDNTDQLRNGDLALKARLPDLARAMRRTPAAPRLP